MRTQSRVELSVDTLYRLLKQENLGDPHPLFTGGERYYSPRFKQESDAQFHRELDRAGLSTPQGVAEDFLDLLAVIQRGAVEYYGWLQDTEGPYSVLVAASGRSAALAQRVDEVVTFEWIDASRALEAFVFRLPNVAAARGEAISVRSADYGKPVRRDVGGFSMSDPHYATPQEARRLAALMKAPRVGGGKLYTAKRDHRGKRTRAKDWISFIDLADGRWALYTTEGRGEKSINAVPGTPQLIARRLSELHASIG
ncbi:ESX secretion-associated protein EspG [Actinokineospora iranica]|uniref:EspG family protein n=1 Tax=Actinokineospora iranica TaxID=1271860 RepID=A0A1G6Q3V9_9PSEU|nr:ESX secretion-associated protein EspG [Actinokineospora iranica]SDC86327.1 EspG family protein [Actinokineospora iranica]